MKPGGYRQLDEAGEAQGVSAGEGGASFRVRQTLLRLREGTLSRVGKEHAAQPRAA